MSQSAWPPTRGESDDPVLAELIEQFTNRLQAGERVDVEAFAAGHPERADQLRALLPALQVLAEAAPAIKRQVVVSCAACITADRQVTVREAELLRAISDTLNCPMPPLTVEP